MMSRRGLEAVGESMQSFYRNVLQSHWPFGLMGTCHLIAAAAPSIRAQQQHRRQR